MKRTFNFDILDLIQKRWSSRAFSPEQISRDTIKTIIEAARYAPSCFNEQPWHFIIADTPDTLNILRQTLTPNNKLWAAHAPVLILVCAKKAFSSNGKDNFWHQFDTGTAWGYLTIEAERQGLLTHGMAGFDRTAAEKAFDVPEDFEAIALVAAGKPGAGDYLSDELKQREQPGTRKELKEICSFGKFSAAQSK